MIFPIAPIGVTLVSPVARAATTESRNAAATETTPRPIGTPNHACCIHTHAMVEPTSPHTNHRVGTSTAASGSTTAGPRLKTLPSDANARPTICQRKAKAARLALTISAVPGHTLHFERSTAWIASGVRTGMAWAASAAFTNAGHSAALAPSGNRRRTSACSSQGPSRP